MGARVRLALGQRRGRERRSRHERCKPHPIVEKARCVAGDKLA